MLGIPSTETPDILIINYNTIDLQTSSKQTSSKHTNESDCTHKIQYADAQRQCHANTDGITNGNNPKVADNTNNKINYFLPGPSQEADRRALQS